MSSSYSPDLRIELIGTGDQAGVWGVTTNTNLEYVIEPAIAGYISVSVSSANQALTYIDGGSAVPGDNQAVHAAIALTTSTGADFAIYVPPASKLYVIYNASAYTATVYCSTSIGGTTHTGTGVAIPAAKTVAVWADGTNVTAQSNYLPSLALGTDLAVVDGGTGASTASGARTNLGLGSIATQDASNVAITGGAISGITDLAVADGGTGASTASGARTNLGIEPYQGSAADNLTFPVGTYLPVINYTGVYTKYNNSTFTVYRGDDAGAYVYTDWSGYAGATALTGTWAVRGSTNSVTLRAAPSPNLIYLMQRIS